MESPLAWWKYSILIAAMALRFHQRVSYGRESVKRATRGCW
jgi:hypothetical protein